MWIMERMNANFEFVNIKCRVMGILIDFPETKDNDRLLFRIFWSRESNAKTQEEFLENLLNGKLTHPESIRRTRQRLQEKHPNLRGESWIIRHNMEAVICEQLTFLDKW